MSIRSTIFGRFGILWPMEMLWPFLCFMGPELKALESNSAGGLGALKLGVEARRRFATGTGAPPCRARPRAARGGSPRCGTLAPAGVGERALPNYSPPTPASEHHAVSTCTPFFGSRIYMQTCFAAGGTRRSKNGRGATLGFLGNSAFRVTRIVFRRLVPEQAGPSEVERPAGCHRCNRCNRGKGGSRGLSH